MTYTLYMYNGTRTHMYTRDIRRLCTSVTFKVTTDVHISDEQLHKCLHHTTHLKLPEHDVPVNQTVQPRKPPFCPSTCPRLARDTCCAWYVTFVARCPLWNHVKSILIHCTVNYAMASHCIQVCLGSNGCNYATYVLNKNAKGPKKLAKRRLLISFCVTASAIVCSYADQNQRVHTHVSLSKQVHPKTVLFCHRIMCVCV